MTTITTRLAVTQDGGISSAQLLPAGTHMARVEIMDRPPLQRAPEPFDISKLPIFDIGPVAEGMTFSREQIYGDDGR